MGPPPWQNYAGNLSPPSAFKSPEAGDSLDLPSCRSEGRWREPDLRSNWLWGRSLNLLNSAHPPDTHFPINPTPEAISFVCVRDICVPGCGTSEPVQCSLQRALVPGGSLLDLKSLVFEMHCGYDCLLRGSNIHDTGGFYYYR